MNKILSVCIPSYNMERYLRSNLDSFISTHCLDELELIVVNDGSKDKTLEIASEYQANFPDTITIIDKENGHYGSCVNEALKIAKGKYFRMVDADDSINADGLILTLKIMEEINSDCIYTKYLTYIDGIKDSEIVHDPANMVYGKYLNLDSFIIPQECFAMHSMTFRTQFLRDIRYTQSVGICYTDTEFVYFPIMQAKTFYAVDTVLYKYMLGRDGQTMDVKSIGRNFTHFLKIFERIIDYNKSKEINNSRTYIQDLYLTKMLSYLGYSAVLLNDNREYEDKLREIIDSDKDLYRLVKNIHARNIYYMDMWYRSNVFDRFIIRILKFYYSVKLR